MDRTYELMGKLDEVSRELSNATSWLCSEYQSAQFAYDELSRGASFVDALDAKDKYLMDDMIDSVEMASEYLTDAFTQLQAVDEAIMKLLHIRGQLTEEIDLPIGGKRWVRYETYSL